MGERLHLWVADTKSENLLKLGVKKAPICTCKLAPVFISFDSTIFIYLFDFQYCTKGMMHFTIILVILQLLKLFPIYFSSICIFYLYICYCKCYVRDGRIYWVIVSVPSMAHVSVTINTTATRTSEVLNGHLKHRNVERIPQIALHHFGKRYFTYSDHQRFGHTQKHTKEHMLLFGLKRACSTTDTGLNPNRLLTPCVWHRCLLSG